MLECGFYICSAETKYIFDMSLMESESIVNERFRLLPNMVTSAMVCAHWISVVLVPEQ